MSSLESFNISPIVEWRAHYPDGFSSSRKIKVPTLDNMLMLAVDRSIRQGEPRLATLEAEFDGEELTVEIDADEGNFDGLVVVHYKIPTTPFNRLRAEVREDRETIRIGTGHEFRPIPQGRQKTLLGRVDGMIAFATGHTSIEIFRPKET